MKQFNHAELYKLDGDVPLLRSVPYGVQHILAMFVANLAPIFIVAGVAGLDDGMTGSLVQSAMLPKAIFLGEPKSGAPLPPPNDAAPTLSSEKPMAVTTTAATIGEMMRRQYLANRPSTPSMTPPTMTAPMAAL